MIERRRKNSSVPHPTWPSARLRRTAALHSSGVRINRSDQSSRPRGGSSTSRMPSPAPSFGRNRRRHHLQHREIVWANFPLTPSALRIGVGQRSIFRVNCRNVSRVTSFAPRPFAPSTRFEDGYRPARFTPKIESTRTTFSAEGFSTPPHQQGVTCLLPHCR